MTPIRVELELDNGTFVTRMLHAGESVQQFNQNIGGIHVAMSRATEASQGFLATLRDVTITLGLARSAFETVRAVTTGWVGDIVKINAENERMAVLLRGMSGAADPIKDAGEQIKFLRDFAKDAPFSLKALQDTFVKMKSTGIDPMNGSLKALTDGIAAVGGSDEQLKRATIAITQMSGKGVIQMEELRQQLGEAMPRAVEIMARSMGVSMGELIQDISKGTVDAKKSLALFTSELELSFGGAAREQMETFNGQLSRTATLLQNLALTVGGVDEKGQALAGGFFDTVKKQLVDLNEALSSNTANELAKSLGSGLTQIVGYLRQAIEWVVKFKTEILEVGKILAEAFAAKMAISGLLALGGTITAVRAEMVALGVQMTAVRNTWAITQTQMLFGTLGFAGGISQLTGWMTRLGAVAGLVGAGLAGLGSIIVPLAGAVAIAAAAFGLFSNKAKDAYENLNKFGATSREQIQLAQQYAASLKAQIDARQKIIDQALELATMGPARAKLEQKLRIRYDMDGLEASYKQVADTVAVNAKKLAEIEQQNRITDDDKELEKRLAKVKEGYDEEAVAASKAHEQELKRLKDAGLETQKQRNAYMDGTRARQIVAYDKEIDVLQEFLDKAKRMRESANADEVATGEKLYQKRLSQLTQAMQQREALANTPDGVPKTAKPDDYEKMLERAKGLLDGVNGKIAEEKASIAGLSGEYAKLAYILENAVAEKKKFSLDNDKVLEFVNQLKEAQKQLDILERSKKLSDLVRDLQAKVNVQPLEDIRGKNKNFISVMREIEQAKAKKVGPFTAEDIANAEQAIQLAKQYDSIETARENKKRLADKYDSYTRGREAAVAALEEREDELQRRFQDESKFKFSNEYHRQFKQITADILNIQAVAANGIIPKSTAEKDLAERREFLRRLKDLEVGNAIQTMQQKNVELRKELMTEDQARQYALDTEIKRNQDLLIKSEAIGEQRVLLEKTVTDNINLLRRKAFQDSPIGKMLKEWTDVSARLQQAAVGWMDSFTDKLAEMVVKGKADFKSLADSILQDLARLAIRGVISNFLGGFGLSVPQHHAGGVIGAVPATRALNLSSLTGPIPKFHGGGMPGGLKPDEVLNVAKKGEITGWPNQLAHAFGGAGKEAVQNNTFNVSVQGSAGTPEQNDDLVRKMTKSLEQTARQIAAKEVRTQMRPGGLLYGRH